MCFKKSNFRKVCDETSSSSLRANVTRELIKAIYQSFWIDSKWDFPYFHVIYCRFREPMVKIREGQTRVYHGTYPTNQFSRDCNTDVKQVVVYKYIINFSLKSFCASQFLKLELELGYFACNLGRIPKCVQISKIYQNNQRIIISHLIFH